MLGLGFEVHLARVCHVQCFPASSFLDQHTVMLVNGLQNHLKRKQHVVLSYPHTMCKWCSSNRFTSQLPMRQSLCSIHPANNIGHMTCHMSKAPESTPQQKDPRCVGARLPHPEHSKTLQLLPQVVDHAVSVQGPRVDVKGPQVPCFVVRDRASDAVLHIQPPRDLGDVCKETELVPVGRAASQGSRTKIIFAFEEERGRHHGTLLLPSKNGSPPDLLPATLPLSNLNRYSHLSSVSSAVAALSTATFRSSSALDFAASACLRSSSCVHTITTWTARQMS